MLVELRCALLRSVNPGELSYVSSVNLRSVLFGSAGSAALRSVAPG
jgi:hypothetical protein